MRSRVIRFVALSASIAAASVAAAPRSNKPLQTPASPVQGAGLAIINGSCTSCHDSTQIMQARPAADWPPIIERMRANGASISDADAKVLLDYLTRNYSTKG